MERSFIQDPELTAELARFVEIRLHTDVEGGAAFRALQESLAQSLALPTYVILDASSPEKPLAVFAGSLFGADFLNFLKAH